MDWTQKSLKILGLNDTEVSILNALQSIKNTNDIVKDTKISRTGVVYSLKNLSRKGLIEKIRIGKRYKYVALSPTRISEELKKVSETICISSGTVQGTRIKTSTESEFVVHVGTKEMVLLFEKVMSLNRGERWKAIQPNKSWMNMHKILSSEDLVRINDSIKNNGIIVDGVLQDNAYRLYHEFFKQDKTSLKAIAESFIDRAADYTLVPHQFFNYNAEIWLIRNTVCILNWLEGVAIEITNPDIRNFIKDMFEIVKEQGVKVDHNQAMREILAGK